MKKIFITIVLITYTSLVMAERFQDTIHSMSSGKRGEDHLLFFESGKVVFVDPKQYSLEDFEVGAYVEVWKNHKHELESIISLPPKVVEEIDESEIELSPDNRTVLDSYQEANSIFKGMNRSYKSDTECTDRAHVWSYEEWKKHDLISKKVFLFFTDTYIRRYNYHWWFHVSPYVLVKSTDGTITYTMDRRYSSKPLLMKNWTDIFIRSKRSCPQSTYAYYRTHKNGVEHCFQVRSTMYNRLPYHVRMEEDSGVIKDRFISSEVNFSYRAFTRRGVSPLR